MMGDSVSTVFYAVTMKVDVSPAWASIRGKVTAGEGPVVEGAQVFLRSADLPTKQRVVEKRASYSSESGEHQFAGLAPGRCWVMSRLEYAASDDAQIASARAAKVTVAGSEERVEDLALFAPRQCFATWIRVNSR